MKESLAMLLVTLPLMGMPLSPDTIVKEFKTTAGKKLELDLKTGGSIRIDGWDKDLVSVKVSRRGRDAENSRVEFEERPSGLSIHSFYAVQHRNNSADLEFEISLPRTYDVDLESWVVELTFRTSAAGSKERRWGASCPSAT